MKMRHTHGVMVELTVRDEPTLMRGLAQERFYNIEQRITELRALLAKGNQALSASRELLRQLAQLECRWADWYANGLIKASAATRTAALTISANPARALVA
jgi:hypothetical protein